MPVCTKCGCNWITRVASPVSCPNCKSRNWSGVNLVREVKRIRRLCVKCGYDWFSHGGVTPKQCPNCKSKAWSGQHNWRGDLVAAASGAPACFMCGGVGCPSCKPAAPARCVNCNDVGMVAARGGCPSCGKVYVP
jgi:predicted Zn-ribbon and HTH transcriptional regulator